MDRGSLSSSVGQKSEGRKERRTEDVLYIGVTIVSNLLSSSSALWTGLMSEVINLLQCGKGIF